MRFVVKSNAFVRFALRPQIVLYRSFSACAQAEMLVGVIRPDPSKVLVNFLVAEIFHARGDASEWQSRIPGVLNVCPSRASHASCVI